MDRAESTSRFLQRQTSGGSVWHHLGRLRHAIASKVYGATVPSADYLFLSVVVGLVAQRLAADEQVKAQLAHEALQGHARETVSGPPHFSAAPESQAAFAMGAATELRLEAGHAASGSVGEAETLATELAEVAADLVQATLALGPEEFFDIPLSLVLEESGLDLLVVEVAEQTDQEESLLEKEGELLDGEVGFQTDAAPPTAIAAVKPDASVLGAAGAAPLAGAGGGGGGGIPVSGGGASAPAVSGALINGYIAGARVFQDKNGNGSWDDGESFAFTDAGGNFSLQLADPNAGPLVAIGGVDRSTNLAYTNVLTAPVGATVITPLTTLIQSLVVSGNQTPEAAQASLSAAFGISPSVDLLKFDPVKTATATNAQGSDIATALAVKAAGSTVANLMSVAGSAIAGASDAGPSASAVTRDVANAIANAVVAAPPSSGSQGVGLLANTTVIGTIINNAATTAGTTVDTRAVDLAKTAVSSLNTLVATAASGSDSLAALTSIAQAQTVAQGSISTTLQQVSTDLRINPDSGVLSGASASVSALTSSSAISAVSVGTVAVPVVDASNRPPVLTVSDGSIANSSSTITLNFLASDPDPADSSRLLFSVAGGGRGAFGELSVVGSTGVATYTLNPKGLALLSGQRVTDSFTVSVTDGVSPTFKTVQIAVTGTLSAKPVVIELTNVTSDSLLNNAELTNNVAITVAGRIQIPLELSDGSLRLELRSGETTTSTLSVTPDSEGRFSVVLPKPSLAALGQGEKSILATYTPPVDSPVTAPTSVSRAFIIDSQSPTLAITSAKSSLKAGETATITFTFSEDPGTSFSWNGSVGDITVTGGTLGALTGSGLTRTAIFAPTANLATGTANIKVAQGSYTDAAGNTGVAGVTPTIAIDTLAPAAPTVAEFGSTDLADNVLNYSEAGTTTFRAALPTTGSLAVAGDKVELLLNGAAFAMPKAVTLTATNITNRYVDFTLLKADLGSDGSKALTAVVSDVAGNVGSVSGAVNFTLDTTAPAAPTVAEFGSADLADSLLNNGESATTTFRAALPTTGSLAVAGDKVELLLNGVAFATPKTVTLTATNITNRYVDFTVLKADLGSDGSKALTAVVTDVAGNVGSVSGAVNFTLDTTAPLLPTLSLSTSTDTGISSTDRITSNTAPAVIVGLPAGSATGHIVSVFLGSATTPLVTKTLLASDVTAGSVTLAIPTLTGDGEKMFVARVTDLAGNTGAASLSLVVTLDTDAAANALITGITGKLNSSEGFVSSRANPEIMLIAESNASFELYKKPVAEQDDPILINWETSISSVTLDSGRSLFTIVVLSELDDGDYGISVVDLAGNVSGVSVTTDVFAIYTAFEPEIFGHINSSGNLEVYGTFFTGGVDPDIEVYAGIYQYGVGSDDPILVVGEELLQPIEFIWVTDEEGYGYYQASASELTAALSSLAPGQNEFLMLRVESDHDNDQATASIESGLFPYTPITMAEPLSFEPPPTPPEYV
jgi:VCBS repeat-containing protein